MTPALAQQKQAPVSQASDTGEAFLNKFFSDHKNPFSSPFKPAPTIKESPKNIIPVVVRPTAPVTSVPLASKPSPPISVKTLGLKLKGIVWDTERPQAIINDRVVDVGDTINQAKVMAIGPQGVELQYKGQKLTLKREGI